MSVLEASGNAIDEQELSLIGSLTLPEEVVSGETSCAAIGELFDANRHRRAIIVALEEAGPPTIISRTHYYSLVAGRMAQGHPIHAEEPIRDIVDEEPVIASSGTPIDEVGMAALAGDPRCECVVVCFGDGHYGTVRISDLHRLMSDIYRVSQATAKQRLLDLQRAQAELVQAQKLESVGQLAAGIAHEINTPMQYIGDNTHFLKATVGRLLAIADAAEAASAEDASDEDRAALAAVVAKSKLALLRERAPKAADDALAGVENVSRIVTAMKRFSHPGSDEFEPVDLNEAITTTMTVCRNEWKYNAEIVTELDEALPLIEGRLGPLNQVWLNMIVNATHAIADAHGEDKGEITVTTSALGDGSSVQVTIADNGSGISAEHLNKVFDHFFTTKEVGKGTGQGLAIAHQVIVSEHHGSLTVDSTLGQGTTFTITLPLTQPADAEKDG